MEVFCTTRLPATSFTYHAIIVIQEAQSKQLSSMAGHGVDNDDDDDDEKTCHLPACNEMQKLHAASQGQLCGAAFQFGQQAMRIVGATSNKHSSIIPCRPRAADRLDTLSKKILRVAWNFPAMLLQDV